MMSLANERLEKYRNKKILKVPKLKPTVFEGSNVRIASSSFPENRRDAFFTKKGILPQWSNNTFTVTGHVQADGKKTKNDLFLVDGASKLFTSDELQRVPEYQDDTIPERPVFNPKFDARNTAVKRRREYITNTFIRPPVRTRARVRQMLTPDDRAQLNRMNGDVNRLMQESKPKKRKMN